MMFKEVHPKIEANVKKEGATSTPAANLRKPVEGCHMKVEEGLVDELAHAADLSTPETGEKRVTTGTGAVPNEPFDETQGQVMSAKAYTS